jgi:hypothetical protein
MIALTEAGDISRPGNVSVQPVGVVVAPPPPSEVPPSIVPPSAVPPSVAPPAVDPGHKVGDIDEAASATPVIIGGIAVLVLALGAFAYVKLR